MRNLGANFFSTEWLLDPVDILVEQNKSIQNSEKAADKKYFLIMAKQHLTATVMILSLTLHTYNLLISLQHALQKLDIST